MRNLIGWAEEIVGLGMVEDPTIMIQEIAVEWD
jgi:hypothetical protein